MSEKGSGDFSIGSALWPGTSKLIEETGELQQVLGKLIATAGDTEHWSGDLMEMLIKEIADTKAALSFFCEMNLSRDEFRAMDRRHQEKWRLFQRWHSEQPPKKKPQWLIDLSRRVSALESAAISETESGYRCLLCDASVVTENGADPLTHEASCPLAKQEQKP